MNIDVAELVAFYEAPLGRIARHLVGARLRTLWPSLAGERVLGLGFTGPYLRPLLEDAERVAAMMPAGLGVTAWPADGVVRSALVLEDSLPLPDASVDRILVVHGFEHVDNPRRVLRELWRVLTPGGRMVAVVPNRAGLWARSETTPFATGRPYSRRQIDRLLGTCLFSPVGWSEALFVPPWPRRFLMGSARAWERVGSRFWPAFGGVILVEAEKRLYQAIPAKARTARRGLLVPAAIARRQRLPAPGLIAAAERPPARRTGSRTPTAC
jgi:SAM-dependent methyltransferase